MTEVVDLPIKELNLEIIQPNTQTYNDPKNNGGSKIITVGKPGCFSRGTPVLMFDGKCKAVEEVKKGDLIMGWDSTPRTVLELCRNRDEMFKIVPIDWEPYTVNKQHKLVLKNINMKNTIEITVEEYMKKTHKWKRDWFLFKTGVDFSPKKIPGEPYAFGCTGNVSHEFLTNTREIRLQVLAGYADTFGFTVVKNGRVFFCVECNKYNQDNMYFLSNSLGFFTQKTEGYIIIGGDLTQIPTEKLMVDKSLCQNAVLMSGFKIEPQGEGDYYGFTIDGDHRFLLGSFDVVRNTGKTTLIASLLYAKKHIFPVAQAYSGTEDSNGFYRKIFPSTFVFNTYDEEQIKSFVKRQKIAKQHIENPWAVIIIDDCTDDPALFKKPLQQGMYKRGRHWAMWYILSLQYGMDVRPVIRTNVDGVFILREPNLRNRRVMYENYAGVIPDFKLFCEIMDQLTGDYTALYIHNATRTNDWRDCIFWYKATIVPENFKFGCPDYWNFHFQRYNPEYVDPITV